MTPWSLFTWALAIGGAVIFVGLSVAIALAFIKQANAARGE